jgi:hypothetical protein
MIGTPPARNDNRTVAVTKTARYMTRMIEELERDYAGDV